MKKQLRYVVSCLIPTEGGSRFVHSAPLQARTASDIEEHFRRAGYKPTRVAKYYTKEELEKAKELAELGLESNHLGEVKS